MEEKSKDRKNGKKNNKNREKEMKKAPWPVKKVSDEYIGHK